MADIMVLEMAEAEFDRFAVAWELDIDLETMNEDDRASFDPIKRRLLGHIRRGTLVVNNDGETLVYTLSRPIGDTSELTFGMPNGDAILRFDKFKNQQTMGRLNSYMASMCQCNPAIFAERMKGSDLKVCHAVATLFLVS